MNRERNARLLLVLSIVLAAASLLPWLDVLPGLHGDEAWSGLRARSISRGLLPAIGMNDYTGPFHQYLCALVMSIWRFHVAGLRLTGVLLNLAALGFAFAAIRRTLGEQTAGLYCLLLVATPAFSIYGRIAMEVTALSFCLAAAAAACATRRTRGAEWLTGALLAVGVWNHLIFVVVPLAFFAIALVFREPLRRCLRVALGLSVVLLLRFALSPPTAEDGSAGTSVAEALGGLAARAAVWPQMFAACLHGDILFMRHVGRVEFASVPVFAVLLLGGVLASAVAAFGPAGRPHRALILVFATVLGGTLLIAPHTADRYYLLAIYLTPLFAAYWLARLKLSPNLSKLQYALLAVLCLAQGARVAVNFHAAHLATGGGLTSFQFGEITETSSHFVRTDRVYQRLVETHVKRVYAEYFIVQPLAFYNLGRRPKIKFREEPEKPLSELTPNERMVRYGAALSAPSEPLIDRSVRHFEILAPTKEGPH